MSFGFNSKAVKGFDVPGRRPAHHGGKRFSTIAWPKLAAFLKNLVRVWLDVQFSPHEFTPIEASAHPSIRSAQHSSLFFPQPLKVDMLLPIVLASRSPRRIELLRMIVPPERIVVCPPPSAAEDGFEGLSSLPQISHRLLEIARHKHDQTRQLLHEEQRPFAALIAADTTVVAAERTGEPVVLGQPPDGPDQNALVRKWFREYYAGREHQVLTGVCLSVCNATELATKSFVVTSSVRFHADVDRWLDWYLQTGESSGKAGGYAIQGAGSLFVEQVTGSLSNVVGLPIREVQAALWELGLPPENKRLFDGAR